ncbi:MAG: hypothetical protein HY916_01765 [Desulfovibrio sp.]|jgi:flagellar basal-body rod protein FlgC|nr:hypothetical protein [Desulfovibrio sp.]
MVIDGASSSAQALQAFGTSLDVTAHNVANMTTEGYQPLRAELADGPGGQGVHVAAVSRAGGGLENAGTSATAPAGGDPGEGLRGVSSLLGMNNGVDVTREMVGLMQIERAYSANATMISAVEQTTGRVMDLIA